MNSIHFVTTDRSTHERPIIGTCHNGVRLKWHALWQIWTLKYLSSNVQPPPVSICITCCSPEHIHLSTPRAVLEKVMMIMMVMIMTIILSMIVKMTMTVIMTRREDTGTQARHKIKSTTERCLHVGGAVIVGSLSPGDCIYEPELLLECVCTVMENLLAFINMSNHACRRSASLLSRTCWESSTLCHSGVQHTAQAYAIRLNTKVFRLYAR